MRSTFLEDFHDLMVETVPEARREFDWYDPVKFNKDNIRVLKWLFDVKKRFGLSILNYCVTSNHVHLLVHKSKENIIPRSVPTGYRQGW